MSTDDLRTAIESGEITADSQIDVDILGGPIGGYGFRSGNWPVIVAGIKFKMFCSIPHNTPMPEQRERLINSVKYRIKNAIAGETYVDEYTGEIHYKYASQMERV